MEKIYYNKLCRDNIPDIIANNGFECDVREMDKDEYRQEIARKVVEEANGVARHTSKNNLLADLADLMVTIDAVKKEFGISNEELDAAVEKSIAEKGGYENMLYLNWSSDTTYTSRDQGKGLDE